MSLEGYLKEEFDKIEEKNLGHAEKVIAYSTLGIKYKHDYRYNDALICYKKALEIDPRQGMIYYNMGKALSILDKNKEAARAYYFAYIYNAPCMKEDLLRHIGHLKTDNECITKEDSLSASQYIKSISGKIGITNDNYEKRCLKASMEYINAISKEYRTFIANTFMKD